MCGAGRARRFVAPHGALRAQKGRRNVSTLVPSRLPGATAARRPRCRSPGAAYPATNAARRLSSRSSPPHAPPPAPPAASAARLAAAAITLSVGPSPVIPSSRSVALWNSCGIEARAARSRAPMLFSRILARESRSIAWRRGAQRRRSRGGRRGKERRGQRRRRERAAVVAAVGGEGRGRRPIAPLRAEGRRPEAEPPPR